MNFFSRLQERRASQSYYAYRANLGRWALERIPGRSLHGARHYEVSNLMYFRRRLTYRNVEMK